MAETTELTRLATRISVENMRRLRMLVEADGRDSRGRPVGSITEHVNRALEEYLDRRERGDA